MKFYKGETIELKEVFTDDIKKEVIAMGIVMAVFFI